MIASAQSLKQSVDQGDPGQLLHPSLSRPSKMLALVALVLLSGVFGVSVFLSPPGGDYFTICGFKNLTGLPCPGCGLTHSFCAIGKCHLLAGFEYNLLGPPLFLLFSFLWIRSVMVLAGKPRLVVAFDQFAERVRLVRWFVVAFIIFGLGRILYVAVFHSEVVRLSPMARWISGVIG